MCSIAWLNEADWEKLVVPGPADAIRGPGDDLLAVKSIADEDLPLGGAMGVSIGLYVDVEPLRRCGGMVFDGCCSEKDGAGEGLVDGAFEEIVL